MDFEQFQSKIADYDYLFVGKVSDDLRDSFFLPMGVNEISAGDFFSISGVPGSLKLKKL